MDITVLSQFLGQWLDLIIDAGLICAFFFLWLSWHRNGKRQQQLELMLSQTASQLDEASRHLVSATGTIKRLQEYEQKHELEQQCATSADSVLRSSASEMPPQNSTQATMILRMKREGESPHTIAERLDMPLAQVKLLLKLHAASRVAGE